MKVEQSNPTVRSIKVSILPPDCSEWGLLFDGETVQFSIVAAVISKTIESNASFKRWLARAVVVEGFNPGARRISLGLKDHGVDLEGMVAVGDYEIGAKDFIGMVYNVIYQCDLTLNIEADPRMALISKAKECLS